MFQQLIELARNQCPDNCTSETADDTVEETFVYEADDDGCTEVNAAQTSNNFGPLASQEKKALSGDITIQRNISHSKDNVITAIEKTVEECNELIKKLLVEKEDKTDLFFESFKRIPIFINEAKMCFMTIVSVLESQSLLSSQGISPLKTAVQVFSGTSSNSRSVASPPSGISSLSMSRECLTDDNMHKPAN
ncbi:hypothetical protein PR048_026606, partial [Dryococelus australis]